MVIDRWEEVFLRGYGGWVLVYGRRKVGKTFMLKRLGYSLYTIVSYSGDCIVYDGRGSSIVSI